MAARADDGSAPIRIVAFGDSLTAGYGLKPSEAFPVQLQAALKAKGHNVEIINAGVSGDTAPAGLERFDWAVPDGTEAVILELGANDALRGLAPKQTKASLESILGKLKARNIDVLLTGMRAPSNWGEDYREAFDAMYPELASRHGTLLYPFFLDGVLQVKKYNLDDGMHPTGAGIAVIVERILPSVEELITRVKARRAAK
ncbi:MAG: arylesterase [Hyphomicrobiaceae bacterium]|nr:arylesterase [Hyphomicrobiaceae bacterium]